MCCCGKPTVNGQPGYKWQPQDPPRVRPVDPPTLRVDDTILYDEPGRCGGLDSHCHHYRLVDHFGRIMLVVKHGGGVERFRVSATEALLQTLASVDTHARYWFLNAIYHAHNDGERKAGLATEARWRRAAAEKRIRTRKQRGRDVVQVWIEPKPTRAAQPTTPSPSINDNPT